MIYVSEKREKNLIIGLGNSVLTDDAVGLMLVSELQKKPEFKNPGNLEFKFNHSGGLDLLDDITGFSRVLIIDSLEATHLDVGSVHFFELADLNALKVPRFISTHGVSLPTLWELGLTLGYAMPEFCLLAGVVTLDCRSYGEFLSRELQKKFPAILNEVMESAGMFLSDSVILN